MYKYKFLYNFYLYQMSQSYIFIYSFFPGELLELLYSLHTYAVVTAALPPGVQLPQAVNYRIPISFRRGS